ncbi:transposase [Xanthomonas citri pv. citri]|nr:transposase [Xanthomonas citri pv. citri]
MEQLFARLRWGSDSEQCCPRCGVVRKHYRRRHRKQWRCADCDHVFSVTSGTPFSKHKLPLREILQIVMQFESGAKGRSLLEVSRVLGCTPKTVQANFGKLREVLVKTMDLTPLQGIVHMDGAYFCGKPRKPNRRIKMPKDALKVRFGKKAPTHPDKPWIDAGMTKKNWEKRRNKRVVISLCESGNIKEGTRRVIALVCRAENETYITRIAKKFIKPRAIVMTDECPAYNSLGASFEHYAVNHSREFCTVEGVSDNMSETFNSRMRRSEYGTVHGYRPKYLQDYACEHVWRDSWRKRSQRDRVFDLLGRTLQARESIWWRGYWQGHHRKGEIDLDYFLSRLAA